MKKAFDSVSLKMMEKTLERIKVHDLIIKFLLNLYNKRKINSKKLELLVLNQKESDIKGGSISRIRVGEKKEVVQVKKKKEAIRYLGVWISEKVSKECNKIVIMREVARIYKVLV